MQKAFVLLTLALGMATVSAALGDAEEVFITYDGLATDNWMNCLRATDLKDLKAVAEARQRLAALEKNGCANIVKRSPVSKTEHNALKELHGSPPSDGDTDGDADRARPRDKSKPTAVNL